jgi:hypothetical protein
MRRYDNAVTEGAGERPAVAIETLRPRMSSAVWLLLGSLAFVAIGIWMGRDEGWIGYACAAFFALCGLVAVVSLIPGANSLRIDDDGLTCRSLFRRWSVRWGEIDRFFVVETRQGMFRVRDLVGWNYLPGPGTGGRGRWLSAALAGCEGALPDTYGMKAAELADHLNRCLARSRSR